MNEFYLLIVVRTNAFTKSIILLIFSSNDNTISIAAMIRDEVVCSHFPESIQFLQGSDW